jgi:hypothetical protein
MYEGWYDLELDYNLIHSEPFPLFVGEAPSSYKDFFTPVIFNFTRYTPALNNGPIYSTVLQMPLDDSDLAPKRDDVADFLQAAHVYAEKQPTYWHCAAGINRSAMMAAAYLCLYRGMKIEDSIALLRKQRGDILLNNRIFEKFLLDWLA